jgi:hypothetical protein
MKMLAAVLCAVVSVGAIHPSASGGPGIYAIVDKIVLEPSERAPERIQLWGAFIVPRPMSSSQYLPAQRGFLYFKIGAGRESSISNEWADLKKIAGTGEAIGFAQYWVPNPADPNGNPHRALEVRVHSSGEAASPDEYPLGMGIVKLTGQGNSDIVAQLRNALKADSKGR